MVLFAVPFGLRDAGRHPDTMTGFAAVRWKHGLKRKSAATLVDGSAASRPAKSHRAPRSYSAGCCSRCGLASLRVAASHGEQPAARSISARASASHREQRAARSNSARASPARREQCAARSAVQPRAPLLGQRSLAQRTAVLPRVRRGAIMDARAPRAPVRAPPLQGTDRMETPLGAAGRAPGQARAVSARSRKTLFSDRPMPYIWYFSPLLSAQRSSPQMVRVDRERPRLRTRPAGRAGAPVGDGRARTVTCVGRGAVRKSVKSRQIDSGPSPGHLGSITEKSFFGPTPPPMVLFAVLA